MSQSITSSPLKQVKKRNLTLEEFDLKKIIQAISKAMIEVKINDLAKAEKVANTVKEKLINKINLAKEANLELGLDTLNEKKKDMIKGIFYIEDIQDIVEEALMDSKYFDVAKAYIIYRESHAKLRKRDIFQKRLNLKPYEYPELYEYVNAIRHSY